MTAFEAMWNEYYRFTVERVKGLVVPLPTHHPFYVLIEASGDVDRIQADIEKLLETAMEENMILDAALSHSNASAAAMWRIRDSVSALARTFPYAAHISFSTPASPSTRWMNMRRRSARASRRSMPARSQSILVTPVMVTKHIDLHHEHTPDRRDAFEKLIYQITSEFGGSISGEHGIGILKRLSRTPEELETMRTLKRALDPNSILNPGRIFTM